MGATGGDRRMEGRHFSESISFDPGTRYQHELLYGPAIGSMPTIPGLGQYSARDEILIATDQLIECQARDLMAAVGPKPRCDYAHGSQLDCHDADCQGWLDSVVEWHKENVGGPHASRTAWAAIRLDLGWEPTPSISPERRRRVTDPVVLGEGPIVHGSWMTFAFHIHESASRSDVHELVDRLWKETHTRSGRLARPARAVYWRHLSARGRSHQKIADEWLELTSRWAGDPDASPTPADVKYAAYEEWLGAVRERGRRGRTRSEADGDEELVDASTVGWGLRRLAKLEEA